MAAIGLWVALEFIAAIVCQIHKLALNILDIKVIITDFHAKVFARKNFCVKLITDN